MEYHLNLKWNIVLQSRIHNGAGMAGGLVDRIVVRDQQQRPFIPGATLKGVVRESCERIAATLGFCKIQDPNDITGIENFTSPEKNDYIVDRLFGCNFSGEHLFFRNTPILDSKEVKLPFHKMIMTRNQMDRVLGTSKAGFLYSTEEIVAQEKKLCVKITGVHSAKALTPVQDDKMEEIRISDTLFWPMEYSLLLLGILSVDRIGSSKSRGLGWLKTLSDSIEIQLNGQNIDIPVSTLVGYMKTLSFLKEEGESMEEILPDIWKRFQESDNKNKCSVEATEVVNSNNLFSKIMIKPLSGISITQNRSSQMPEILDYIPGTTLRGALAKIYLDHYGEDQDFPNFFNGKNFFPDILPSFPQNLGQVIPGTAMSCKRNPGFLIEGNPISPTSPHGVYDYCFLHAALKLWEKKRPNQSIPLNLEKSYSCPQCQNLVKEYSGYIHGQKLAKAFYVHIGIDRLTHTSSPGFLYGVESLQPDNDSKTVFAGIARLDPVFLEKLKKLQYLSSQIFLGQNKTRGYGEAVWEIENHVHPDNKDFQNKVINFSDAFVNFCNTHLNMGIEKLLYFTIGMESHTIVVDPWLRYTCDPQILLETLSLLECTPVWERSTLVQVRGWQQKHGLPKEDEFAIQRGSVYLFSAPYSDTLIHKLFEIEKTSSGLRPEEGFGKLCISNRFHIENQVMGGVI